MSELQRKIEKLSTLIEVGKALSSEIEFDKLLELITAKANEVADSVRCTLFLVDEVQQELVSRTATANELREIRIPISSGIAGHVAQTGEILNIPNAYDSPHFNREIDKETGFTTRCILSVPILDKNGMVIGVFQALNKEDGSTFTEQDEELLTAMASQAAVAIQNSLLIAQKIESERLALVGQTASGLVHDVKNSLTSIYGFAQLLVRRLEGTPGSYAQIIFDQTEKVLMMLENLLSFTRHHRFAPTLRPLTLVDFLDKDVLPPLLKDLEDIGIEVDVQHGFTETILMDSGEMRRAISNILINAKEAMPQGGGISLVTRPLNDDRVELRISDSGKGIPEKLIPTIFEPFKSYLKKGGTGLGLYNTREIVTAHGGTIEVKSELGRGTTFILRLPRSGFQPANHSR